MEDEILEFNFTVYRGYETSYTFYLEPDDGLPETLVGVEAYMIIRDGIASETNVLLLIVGDGITLALDLVKKELSLTFTISAAASEAIVQNQLDYTIVLKVVEKAPVLLGRMAVTSKAMRVTQ